MNRRVLTVLVAVCVATVVAGVQAFPELRQFGSDVLRVWLANLGAAMFFSALLTAGYLLTSRHRTALLVFTLMLPFALFASMMPVYSAVRHGVPAEWKFVCPSEAEAYAAPLAVLASLVVLPLAKWWRGL